jgi:hypothetical protein
VSGRRILVGLKSLASGESLTITNAIIASPPRVTVLSPDGAGTLARASGPVAAGSKGNTIVFTYRAGTGGLQDGAVVLTVPDGWSAPSTSPQDPGYVTASTGTVSVSGHTITVAGVTLASGASLTIVYGSRAGGGPGASAPAKLGPTVWPAAERSSTDGTLKPLG